MKFILAGVGLLLVAGFFLAAAYLSIITSAGDDSTWGKRVFRKLRIAEIKSASYRWAAERRTRNMNKSQD